MKLTLIGEDDDKTQEDVENMDLNKGMPNDYPCVRRSKKRNIGKPPTRFGFEKVILCKAPQSTDDHDLPTSFSNSFERK